MIYWRILIVLLIGVSCANNKLGQVGNDKAVSVLIDDRDGQEYEVMLMKDGNYWMAENLNFQLEASWCYNDTTGHCTQYGRLYSWSSALGSCPEGWRLPTDKEWKTMANEYKYATKDSIGLVAPASPKRPYWTTEERRNIFKNLASIGFITGEGGVREAYGTYINRELMEHFWTSTAKGEYLSYSYQFRSSYRGLKAGMLPDFRNIDSGIYCRCIKAE